MEVVQFIMQYKAKLKNKQIDEDEEFKIICDMIRPKKYISFSKKKEIAHNIIKQTVTQDENLNVVYDGCDKYLYTIISLINAYTDLNINENGYDQICSERLLNKIIATFGEEYDVMIGILNVYMEQLESKTINIKEW